MRKFYLTWPKSTAPSKLCWTHYAELLNLKEPDMRARYESIAERNRLSHRELRKLIREENALFRSSQASEALGHTGLLTELSERGLKAAANLRTGSFGSVKRVQSERLSCPKGQVIIDCGFHVLRIVLDNESLMMTETPDYLYCALIDRVIDGDTLAVIVDCGGGVYVLQKIRLRGINALELDTPKGKQAKMYVEHVLKDVKKVVLRTFSTDIHGRYVADLLYLPGVDTTTLIQKDGKYLNQELLDAGHAYVL
jgi:endonuclease YncB( thermonuclease family)